MLRRLGLVGVLWLTSLPVLAQAPAAAPEALLADECLFYFRYDGLEPHRRAYEQTALGEVMKGDLGNLLDYTAKTLRDTVGPMILKEKLLEGAAPDQLMRIQNAAAQVPRLLEYFQRHGFVIGVEVLKIDMPRMQLTLVLPNGGKPENKELIFNGFRLFTTLAGAPVKEVKQGNRTVYQVMIPTGEKEPEAVYFAWWQEGDHVVCILGTEKPDHTLGLVADGEKRRANLTGNPLFRTVAGFKNYETVARGYLNLEQSLKLARAQGPKAGKIIEELGLDGLKGLTMLLGFEGRYQRTTMALHLSGERKGVLRLAAAPASLELDQLPPLPPDAFTVSATHLDLGTLYDVILQGVETVMRLELPEEWAKVQAGLREMDQFLGVSLRNDLLGSLGSTVVIYSAASEGPLFLGTGLAIKVKDAPKLLATLDTLMKLLHKVSDKIVTLKKGTYQNVDVYTVSVGAEGFPFSPSYVIYKDWLLVGLFPQTPQGVLLRATGKYATWQPTPTVQQALAAAKQKPGAKILSVSQTDPRPGLKQILSLAPFIGGMVNSFSPGSFDVAMIPNAQAVTEPLFPNVTVAVDEGDVIRLESYASLAVPFDLTGLDLMFLGGIVVPALARVF
jgi:hypothetical protein